MTEIEKLLIKLLKIPSLSGSEKELGKFLLNELKNDFLVSRQLVEGGRFNVMAKKGRSDIWIVAHMDTVPGEIPLRVTKERIYGRGACDNKGNIAGAIIAGRKISDINLLFTVGEEKDFSGARKALFGEERIIVMEPTKLKVVSSHYGAIGFHIKVKGKAKHSSIGTSVNAIHHLVDILKILKDKEWTSFNIGKIEGGIAPNISAPLASVSVSARPKDNAEFNSIIKSILSLPRNFDRTSVSISAKFKPVNHQKYLKKVLGIEGEIVPYFTEMAIFENSFLFGAGDFHQAHTSDEYIGRRELNQLPEKISQLIGKMKR